MDDCVFCNIINKTLNSEILFENDRLIVIRDILPKAPVHLLIIPKEHIISAHHLDQKHKDMVWESVVVAQEMAKKYGIAETGYKLVVNVGRDGGQVIPHLHMHLLGGKNMPE